MPNALIDFWRQDQAAQGITDDRPDYLIMRDELIPLAKDNPALLEQYPDFAREYGAMRESTAPSLPGELGRALKSGTQGLASTALGGLGLVTGSDYLKEKARSFDEDAGQNGPTIGTLEDIAPGEEGMANKVFSRDALRYGIAKVGNVAPSIAESVATAAAGAALGSAVAPGPGTLAGAVGGVVEKSLVKAAIRSLLKKGIAEEMAAKGLITDATEAGITQALRSGSAAVARDVAAEAADIGAFRGGVAAGAGSSFLLNSGDVASEGADTPTTLALGVVSALPDTILPAYVLKKLFPGAGKAAITAGKSWLARNGVKLAELAGVPAEEFGQEYFQEAVNVVARNIKEGKDPLAFDDADLRRLREAGIGGAAGGLLAAPGVMFSGHNAEARAPGAPRPPTAEDFSGPAATPPPPTPGAPTARTPADVYRAVNQMTPEEQQARLAELQALPTRAPDEDAEVELLRALAPSPVVQSATQTEPNAENVVQAATQAPAETPSAPVPVVPASPAPSPTEAGAGVVPAAATTSDKTQTREEWLREAISQPNVTYQYTVMRLGEGYPDAIQIDVMGAKGENLASAMPEELRALGIELPDVPKGVPQGQYSLAQIQDAAAASSAPPSALAPATGPTEITPPVSPAPGEPGAGAVSPQAAAETFSRAQIQSQRRLADELGKKAEQAANAGKGKRATNFNQQANAARERLAYMEERKLTGPSIPIGSGPEGNNDLLSDIAEIVGKIRTQAPEGTSAAGGEYDLGNTFDTGAARLLRGGTEGTPASEAIATLNTDGGYKFGSVGEFLTAVDNAVAARRKFGDAFKAQAYQRQIEDAALTNTGRRAQLRAKDGVPIAQIGIGGKFFVRGEKFSVVDVTEDGEHYVVQDGHKFLVPAEALVYPDHGTKVVEGLKPSTDFLPEEETSQAPAQPAAPELAPLSEEQRSTAEREDLRGVAVKLEALAENGSRVEIEMDAADAWADTQRRRSVFEQLLNCLKGTT